jgi:cytochrome c-type biogenesis protein CcmF
VAFVAIVVSAGAFLIERIVRSAAQGVDKKTRLRYETIVRQVGLVGYIAVLVTALALTVGCVLLVYCFLAGDVSLSYVVRQHSDASGPLGVLYRISGLWGGREGSLLFWAWLISLFGGIVAVKNLRKRDELDNMALLVIQLVVFAFVVVLLFSEANMPFQPLDIHYLNAQGQLKSFEQLMQEVASTGQQTLEPSLVLGMNVLLEHWAMAIHPPTLFIGYAGLTVSFAYAIAALIVNDPSKKWVVRAQRYALVSWVFLGLGIGLGAIWAYVVLGWGGYWGWDPVENASLLSWLLAVALLHSFTVYRQRGSFKRWSVMCACLAFAFVIVGTFITRSGIVQNSVHAFGGDMVSLWLFLGLILASVLAGVIGLIIRRRSFGPQPGDEEESDSLATRDVAYFFNNVFLVLSAFVIVYLTLATALPSWMPWGGVSVLAATYNAVARPLGILYCLLMAVCPMLSWAKTDGRLFLKRALVPGICALVVFVLLVVYFIIHLVPSYDAMIALGGSQAATLLEAGPRFYYFIITIAGFLAASLLFMNSLFMLGRVIGGQAKAKGTNPVVAALSALHNQPSRFGGFLAHLAMAIILVGLIGSSMYVTTASDYLAFDEASDTASEDFIIEDYRLVYVKSDIEQLENGTDSIYSVTFDVYKGDAFQGRVSPGIFFVEMTQQRKPLAGVLSMPLEDLFVVYNGVNSVGGISLSAFVNPFISFVWVGFGLLMVGTIIAAVGRRGPRAKPVEAKVVGEKPADVIVGVMPAEAGAKGAGTKGAGAKTSPVEEKKASEPGGKPGARTVKVRARDAGAKPAEAGAKAGAKASSAKVKPTSEAGETGETSGKAEGDD